MNLFVLHSLSYGCNQFYILAITQLLYLYRNIKHLFYSFYQKVVSIFCLFIFLSVCLCCYLLVCPYLNNVWPGFNISSVLKYNFFCFVRKSDPDLGKIHLDSQPWLQAHEFFRPLYGTDIRFNYTLYYI